MGDAGHENAVFPLIEETARLLSGVRCNPIPHGAFTYFDEFGNGPSDFLHLQGKILMTPHRCVVTEEDRFRVDCGVDGGEHLVSHRLQSSRKQLHDDDFSVFVDDQRWQAVAFGMHDAITGGVQILRVAHGKGLGDPIVPPVTIDGCFLGREETQADFRRRAPERLTEEVSVGVFRTDDAWRRV